jgi:predicted aspartyl protease
MNNVEIVLVKNPDGTEVEHAIIDRGNGEFTSMPKSVYDEMIAAQSTPIV